LSPCAIRGSLEIGDQLAQPVDVISDEAKGTIASVAQPATWMPALVAMIEDDTAIIAAARIADVRALTAESSFIPCKVDSRALTIIFGVLGSISIGSLVDISVVSPLFGSDLTSPRRFVSGTIGSNLRTVLCSPRFPPFLEVHLVDLTILTLIFTLCGLSFRFSLVEAASTHRGDSDG